MIELQEVTFAYPHRPPVFQRFSWRVGAGETWAVLGPSGCGKSTLLLLLAGLEQPSAGTLVIDGERLARPRPRTGLILQEYGLLPWATIRDNAALGLQIRRFYGPDGRHAPPGSRLDRRAVEARIEPWLDRLGIAEIADAYPGGVSGGQRQRAAVARALVMEPDLLLMDEPFSALDAPTRERLQVLTLDLCAKAGVTVMLVTHNIEEAAFVGQQVLILDHPPNRMPRALDNPHPADDRYREAPDYQAACAQLRSALHAMDPGTDL